MSEDEPDIIRVDGGATCPTCGAVYRDHPWDEVNLAYDGHVFLRLGCDGRSLKL